ncbi:hypothetical protein NNO_1546 [Hydrogenimonas sp.]|nr:hypothetical protein NNO_1546 [Hydrogenimonas sp.]
MPGAFRGALKTADASGALTGKHGFLTIFFRSNPGADKF